MINYYVEIDTGVSTATGDYYKEFKILIDDGSYPTRRIYTSPLLRINVGCGYQPASTVTLNDTVSNTTYVEYGFDATSIANVTFDNITYEPSTLPCKISSNYNSF